MNQAQAKALEERLMAEIVRRRGLGGYSPESDSLLMMTEALYEIVRHMREQDKPVKKRK